MSAMSSCLRPHLLLLLLLSAWLLAAEASPAGYPGRTRARAIRGFKNQALSTARGFGKRAPMTGPLDLLLAPQREGNAAATPNADERESFPAEWIAEELQSNPDLARMIVHKFVDANQDGELTADELLRP